MNLLIVPKPLFTSTMSVEGYFLSYQYGNAILESVKSNPLDRAMNSPFIDFMNEVGLEALTQNHQIFVPITEILLMTSLERECKIQADKVVFILSEKVLPNDTVMACMKHYRELGYKMAVTYTGTLEAIRKFLFEADYVFLDIPHYDITRHVSLIRRAAPQIKMIATEIEAKPIFDGIKHSGIDLFDGAFYKIHIPTSAVQNALSPLKVNYIQLLNIVNTNDFDFRAFTRVVRQDMAMAIQFMRLVNSSSHAHSEIKNLNQAAAMLGQREIKKWVSTAVTNSLCADRPSEITRLSLVRAKFCENMANHFELGMLSESLFLMGLFSVLDVVLEMPIEEALKMVFVPAPIAQALLYGKGELYGVLDFIMQYEYGNWQEISRQSLVRNISIDTIYQAFLDALLWYSNLINMPEQSGDVLEGDTLA
jgi:EAL and modified HD-GYP domain-containing signal transduction protein